MSVRSHEEILALVEGSPNKRALDIANGGLSSLPDELDGLSLHRLRIFTNELTELPPQIRRQRKLRRLSIESNPITVLPDWIGELAELRELEVQRTQLRAARVRGLRKLERLELSFNPIESLELADLPALKALGLHLHQLEELPEALSHAPLEELHVAYGPLRSLPRIGPTLRQLSVDNSALEELPAWLADCPELRILHAGRNPLRRLPTAGLPVLQSVFLDGCGLSEVPELVLRSPGLKVLRLGSNALTTLPEALSSLPLTLLDVKGNALGEVPPCVASMSSLETLELEHNPISSWPTWAPPPRLRRVKIYGTGLKGQEPPPAWRRLVEA